MTFQDFFEESIKLLRVAPQVPGDKASPRLNRAVVSWAGGSGCRRCQTVACLQCSTGMD